MLYYTDLGTCTGLCAGTSTFSSDPALSCGSRPSVPVEDFDVLFSAVAGRLRLSALADTALLPTVVLECTEALEQLHRMLIQSRNTLPVHVLRERDNGAIVNCSASPKARGGFSRAAGFRSAI